MLSILSIEQNPSKIAEFGELYSGVIYELPISAIYNKVLLFNIVD